MIRSLAALELARFLAEKLVPMTRRFWIVARDVPAGRREDGGFEPGGVALTLHLICSAGHEGQAQWKTSSIEIEHARDIRLNVEPLVFMAEQWLRKHEGPHGPSPV